MLSFLKIPYVLNLEYPTVKLLTSMVVKNWNNFIKGRNEKGEEELEKKEKDSLIKINFLAKILEYHLDQIKYLKCDLKLVFRDEKEIEELVENIVKIIFFNLNHVKIFLKNFFRKKLLKVL